MMPISRQRAGAGDVVGDGALRRTWGFEALAAAIAADFEHGHVYSELIWAVLSGTA